MARADGWSAHPPGAGAGSGGLGKWRGWRGTGLSGSLSSSAGSPTSAAHAPFSAGTLRAKNSFGQDSAAPSSWPSWGRGPPPWRGPPHPGQGGGCWIFWGRRSGETWLGEDCGWVMGPVGRKVTTLHGGRALPGRDGGRKENPGGLGRCQRRWPGASSGTFESGLCLNSNALPWPAGKREGALVLKQPLYNPGPPLPL